MTEIRCIAVDDEPLALELVRQYLGRCPEVRLVQTFTDAVAAREFLQQHPADLLLVDINMPDITGLDLVRSLAVRPLVIFTTAYKSFALDAYDLEGLDYLVKPLDPERFDRAIRRAVEHHRLRNPGSREGESVVVRAEYQLVKIPLADIAYIESVEDYLKIHLAQGRPVMTLMTLKAMLQKLPQDRFRRIHRSYIIPLAKIRSVTSRRVRLDTVDLPIGDSYLDFVQEWLGKGGA